MVHWKLPVIRAKTELSLADIVIPDGIAMINTCVFIGYSNLKNIVIPENVKKIANYAVENCSHFLAGQREKM